ncbi:O-antigen ligase family protein [Candidatus Saccharibacteria bacterium]|nr:O-antigen ligase family protein [Candidatus Saccharibacteria bacterium]
MKKLSKVFKFLVKILPAILFFSYFPVISFGTNETMNFELSLPLIWLLIFDVVAFVLMIKKKLLFKNLKWQWVLFPLWLTLTVVWSRNSVRGLLTVGILWLIYFAGYAMWTLKGEFDGKFRESFWKWFFGSAMVVCLWCFLQCILDLAGVPRECSLMCPGCKYETFGFPHPNGFAAEPQFMGNLLLAPAIVAAWMLFRKQTIRSLGRKHSRGAVFTTAKSDSAPNYSSGSSSVAVVKTTTGSCSLCPKFLIVCFFTSSATIFLTLSRGAIFAFIIAMVIMSVVWGVKNKKQLKRIGLVWLMVVLSFLFTLNLQGLMAEVSKTNDTYVSGVSKVINQLTLGKIDLGGSQVKKQEDAAQKEDNSKEESEMKQANFDGYVEVSTEARMSATEAALEAGFDSWQTALFGTGLGSASIIMYEKGVFPTPKEIVNNEYVSLFLETGLIGTMLLIYGFVLVVKKVRESQAKLVIYGLILAYAISLCFFSGLANALQIYLLVPCFMSIFAEKR